jgi:hypothetical protein
VPSAVPISAPPADAERGRSLVAAASGPFCGVGAER